MNNIEQYEFDRQGFLVLKDFLTSQEVTTLAPIINKLVSHGEEHYTQEPRKQSKWDQTTMSMLRTDTMLAAEQKTVRQLLSRIFSIPIQPSIVWLITRKPCLILPKLSREKLALITPS